MPPLPGSGEERMRCPCPSSRRRSLWVENLASSSFGLYRPQLPRGEPAQAVPSNDGVRCGTRRPVSTLGKAHDEDGALDGTGGHLDRSTVGLDYPVHDE